jgi:PAS domain-containing protein
VGILSTVCTVIATFRGADKPNIARPALSFNAVQATLNEKQDAAFIEGDIKLERASGRSPLWVKYKAGNLMVHGCRATVLAIDEVTVHQGVLKENEYKYRRIAENGAENSEKYRLIFEYSPMGLLYFDSNGVILACNDNFVKIIGSSKEKLIGLDMLGLPDSGIVTAVRKALEGGTGYLRGCLSFRHSRKKYPGKGHFHIDDPQERPQPRGCRHHRGYHRAQAGGTGP